jgi:hypothetical protein
MFRHALVIVVLAMPSLVHASGEFVYEGHLLNEGSAAQGSYSFRFTLYDAETNGSAVGSTLEQQLTVTSGVFSASLDFGALAFSGEDRWLQIEVAGLSDGSFTVLTPRQKLSPVPYSWLGLGNVKITGDTMTGRLYLPPDGLVVGDDQLVTEQGRVGIGTPYPEETLHVNSNDSSAKMRFSAASNPDAGVYYSVGQSNDDFGIWRTKGTSGPTLMLSLTPSGTITLAGSVTETIRTASDTGPHITLGDSDSILVVDTSQSPPASIYHYVYLPAPNGIPGRRYTVKRLGLGTLNANFAVQIYATGGGSIDGSTFVELPNAYDSRTMVSDGTRWLVMSASP